jgi:hypothetical protein
LSQHFFLQHIPSIPHLRSLYIPFLADHVHGSSTDPRELALQVVDIVALRPNVELCYMGVGAKCFEILESRRDWDSRADAAHLGLPSVGGAAAGSEDGEEEEEEEEEDGEEELDGESDADEETESDAEHDDDEDDDFDDDVTDSDSDSSDTPRKNGKNGRAAKLRLREILFYDDKVAVFKARHGRL